MNRTLQLAFALCIPFLSSAAYGQDPCQPVKVFVLDADSGRPIDGAIVVDVGSGESLTTDTDGTGDFSSAVGDDGSFIFEVAAQGYPEQYRRYEFGSAPTNGGQGGYTCTVGASRIATLYLDAGGEMLSAPIGSAGGEVEFRKVTGQTIDGQDFMQRVSLSVPAGLWDGRYRIAISLPKPEAFITAYLPESVTSGGVVGGTRYPLAQLRIDLQDMSGQPVDLGTWSTAMHVKLSSARGDAEFVDGQLESIQWYDELSKTWSSSGAQVTGFDASAKAVEFDLLRAGHYTIAPLLGLTPKDVGPNCIWKSLGSFPIICGGGASPFITTRSVASDPCGVLFDNSPTEVDQEITKMVNTSTSVGLNFKVADAILSSGFKFDGSVGTNDTYKKRIKETRHLNPAVVEGKSGTATLFISGRTYVWGLFCDGDTVPQAQSAVDVYSGTCWDISELVPCK